ncbi:MAG: metal-dependent hydrolase [Thermodesulfobacteriota bacterium]
MDPVTHVAAGVVCSQLVASPSRWWGALAGVIFALLPDIDYFFIFWDRLAFIRYHRGFTHSLVALPLFAVFGALAGRLLGGPRWFKPLFCIGVIVLASHLLLDLATSYGTQILSPFSRRRFTLDWVFIIDPYLTAVLVIGALSALTSQFWGPRLGAWFLGAAGVYILICALYHHQALTLARQVFRTENPQPQTIAALPQPFTCRRWQLIAARPGEIQQAFVQLPFDAALGVKTTVIQGAAVPVPQGADLRVPAVSYHTPSHLVIQAWKPVVATAVFPREAEKILAGYLEFARFPLLIRAQSHQGQQLLEWLDLRFSIPGRPFPFVLQLSLDAQGRLQHWLIGRRG